MRRNYLPILAALTLIAPLSAEIPPPDEDLDQLVLESLTAFNQAVAKDDFTDFLATMSTPAREQLTPERLTTAFQDFIAKKVNFADIEGLTPDFDSKEINEKAVLRIEGSYPTTPVKVHFALGYVQEDGEWKLLAIKVNTYEDNSSSGSQTKE